MKATAEHQRMFEYRQRKTNLRKWRACLSKRSWGTDARLVGAFQSIIALRQRAVHPNSVSESIVRFQWTLSN